MIDRPGDDEAARLLGVLDRELATPSTVDIQRAMVVGGRLRRTRRVAGYGMVAAAVSVALAGASVLVTSDRPVDRRGAAPASSAPSSGSPPATVASFGPPPTRPGACTVSRLSVPGEQQSVYVYGADPTGRYLVGTGSTADAKRTVFVWDGGQPIVVPLTGADPKLADMTTAGVGVGSAWGFRGPGSKFRPIPYLYQGGKITELTGVANGFADAINGNGVVVGSEDPTTPHAVVWRSSTQRGELLPEPSGTTNSNAVDVDEDGTIVGNVVNGARATPYVWLPDGTHHALPIDKDSSGQVYGIRGGWVIGTITAAGGTRQAVRWNLRTGDFRPLPMNGRPNAVNAHGWVTGTDAQGRAIVVIGDSLQVLSLPDLEYHKSGEQTNMPMTISDDGRTIGGQAFDREGLMRGVVWRCS